MSHKLLLRAGFARQLMAGVYSLLPLGLRVTQKITNIIRAEMNGIGGQEFKLPAMHPREVWERSGRWQQVGPELFRLKDRSGGESLAPATPGVTCAGCNASVPPGKFCSACGSELKQPSQAAAFCSGCGAPMSADAQFCGQCGNKRG